MFPYVLYIDRSFGIYITLMTGATKVIKVGKPEKFYVSIFILFFTLRPKKKKSFFILYSGPPTQIHWFVTCSKAGSEEVHIVKLGTK